MGRVLPIVYVRGFAGSTKDIDMVVDDPFYGFNAGSTHIRVGRGGEPRFYQFESPLVRLMMEHGYVLKVEGGQLEYLQRADKDTIAANTVWIYRFYDASASTFGREPAPYRIEEAAEGLRDFVRLVLDKTKDADQVCLVAHSMGGLICRSLIQRYLEKPEDTIAKVFTYGTPHGGIDVELGGPVGEWVIETFGPNGSDIFRPKRMYEYLTPDPVGPKPDDWDPRTLGKSGFPPHRFFCLVGTNAKDYDGAAGWSARAIGVKSDGLVQIRNAYVKGSNRAYVHRSHSGRYGLVNSEEGYQNLRRFLFGNLRVETGLAKLALDTSDDRTWQADVRLAIRQLPVNLHEQTAEHYCPVQLLEQQKQLETPDSPVPLVTTYLLPSTHPSNYARYALNLRVTSLQETGGMFNFFDHLEQIADWEDTLIVDVQADEQGKVRDARWEWNSRLPRTASDPRPMPNELQWTERTTVDGIKGWLATVPLPPIGRALIGQQTELSLRVSPWS